MVILDQIVLKLPFFSSFLIKTSPKFLYSTLSWSKRPPSSFFRLFPDQNVLKVPFFRLFPDQNKNVYHQFDSKKREEKKSSWLPWISAFKNCLIPYKKIRSTLVSICLVRLTLDDQAWVYVIFRAMQSCTQIFADNIKLKKETHSMQSKDRSNQNRRNG